MYRLPDIDSLLARLAAPCKVALTFHENPDGDAVGSTLALGEVLRSRGHTVTILSPGPLPHFLGWLPGVEAISCIEKNTPTQQQTEAILQADVICCLDFSQLKRNRPLAAAIQASQAFRLVIDHHAGAETFADLLLCDPQAPSTASLIYWLIRQAGWQELLSPAVATCLYVGIFTDTGSFQHSNTDSLVLRAAADLVERGARPAPIAQQLLGSQSLNKYRFLAHIVQHRLVVMPEERVAFFHVPAKDFIRFPLQPGETAGLANYLLQLQGVWMAVAMLENKGEVRLSCRSLGNCDVARFAQCHFQGGGHPNAAGGVSRLSLQETVDRFMQAVRTDHPCAGCDPLAPPR